VFDSYAPGNTYDIAGLALTVGNGYTEGNLFRPTLSGYLLQIDFALGYMVGSNTVDIQLRADNGGTPGALIESYNALLVTNTYPSQGSVVSAISTLQPVLQGGTPYWVLVSADARSNDPWYLNSVGMTGPYYMIGPSAPGGAISTDTLGTFRVIDDVIIPEPAAAVSVLSALCCGVFAFRRRRA
jgi:hypothetical protein